MIGLEERYIFHVHSYRCGHAQMIEDEAYVKQAILLGSQHLFFTEHAPYPDNPFTTAMKYEQLEEYIETLTQLKNKYQGQIEIHIGLESEYLPSYHDHYVKLKNTPGIELLILGQHFFEGKNGTISIDYDVEIRKEIEARGCVTNMILGIQTGLFDVVAHPDRCFRRKKEWDEELEELSKQLISTSYEKGMYLEKNLASMHRRRNYWKQFWALVPKNHPIIVGSDAHDVSELVVIQKGTENEL